VLQTFVDELDHMKRNPVYRKDEYVYKQGGEKLLVKYKKADKERSRVGTW